MVRSKAEILNDKKPSPFNGNGEILVRNILTGEEEMYQAGRVFCHTTVYPDSEIGYHVHTKESETYYILSGTAELNDNGETKILNAGDVVFTGIGEGHSIKCISEEPVELIALILFDKR